MFCLRKQPFYSTELNSTSETKACWYRAGVELQSSQLSTAVARRLKQESSGPVPADEIVGSGGNMKIGEGTFAPLLLNSQYSVPFSSLGRPYSRRLNP